jgi:hypothetical protein
VGHVRWGLSRFGFVFLPQLKPFRWPALAAVALFCIWHLNPDPGFRTFNWMHSRVVHHFNRFVFLHHSKEFLHSVSAYAKVSRV